MNHMYEPKEMERVMAARESFSGRLLTDAQFDEAMAVTNIIEREIQKSGAFKEKLGDYAHAFARTERFDSMKAETILRDLFKERTGKSMNQMRETLVEREKGITDDHRNRAYQAACEIGQMIENGKKMSFNRAYAHQASFLAREIGITDAAAKGLMKEEFKAVERAELYDWAKELEERFYRPQIEADKQQRETTKESERQPAKEEERTPQRQRTYTRTRTGPSGPR